MRDANEILPQSQIFLNRERNSYAPFDDWFRYRLLAATDIHWVELDGVALRPPKEAGLTSEPERSFLTRLLRDRGVDLVIYEDGP